MPNSQFVYVTYIRSTPQAVWRALTESEFTRKFWFDMTQDCAWSKGASWTLKFPDGRLGDTGKILEVESGKRVVIQWQNEFRPELKAEGPAQCTYDIEPVGDGVVKLTITHTSEQPRSKVIEAVSTGWPRILSNLKSLLETGTILFDERPI